MGRRQTNTHGAICMVYESLIPAYLQPGRSHPGGKLGDYCTYPRLRFTSLSRDLSRLQPDFNELQLRQGPAPCGRAPFPPAPAAVPGSGCHSWLHRDTPRAQGHPGDPRDPSVSQGTSLRAEGHPCTPFCFTHGQKNFWDQTRQFWVWHGGERPQTQSVWFQRCRSSCPATIPFSHFLLIYHLILLPLFSYFPSL